MTIAMMNCLINPVRSLLSCHLGPISGQLTSISDMHQLLSVGKPAGLSRIVWKNGMLVSNGAKELKKRFIGSHSVVCFRENDEPLPERFIGRKLSLSSNLEVKYSPWAEHMLNGLGRSGGSRQKESTGGPPGGRKGGDDEGGNGGGGGGDDDWEEYIYLLPVLTLALGSVFYHLLYCVAIWVKDQSFDSSSCRTAMIIFQLLAAAAIRLTAKTGIDAYILGLGASVGVMVWTGDQRVVQKEGNSLLGRALFAASMAIMFASALINI